MMLNIQDDDDDSDDDGGKGIDKKINIINQW